MNLTDRISREPLVHYVTATGVHINAVIARPCGDIVLGQMQLYALFPDFGWRMIEGVYYSPDLKSTGTWHFIERTEA